MNKRDQMILEKIVRYCDEIEETHRFFQYSEELFCDKQRGFIYRNAVTMAILQIGELSKHLSEQLVSSQPSVPWKQIIRTRDVYAHHYGSIEYEVVWKTSHESISELKNLFSTE